MPDNEKSRRLFEMLFSMPRISVTHVSLLIMPDLTYGGWSANAGQREKLQAFRDALRHTKDKRYACELAHNAVLYFL